MAADLYDQTFEDQQVRELRFEGGEFHSCRFVGCQLSGAALAHARFHDCEFIHCDLSNVSVRNSSFRNLIFKDTKLIGVDWAQAKTLVALSFDSCVLNYSNFSGTDLRHAKMIRSVAREAIFSDCNLTQADCRETDFHKSEFSRANLREADFRQALNYRIHPGECLLKKTRFSLPEATSLLYGLDIVIGD